MSTKPTVHAGRVMPSAKGTAISATDAFSALSQIVEAARECIKLNAEHATLRRRIEAYEATEVARIKAGEAILKDYFTKVFAERHSLFEELFARLDQAVDDGNGETLNTVVRGIVDIARTSPLADLGDLAKVRAALDDPDQVWDL